MRTTRATRTTPTTGRVYIEGQAVGLWWECEGGGVAGKCGPLGDFAAESPEALAGLVAAADAERLRRAGIVRPTKRRHTRNNQEQHRTPTKSESFGRLAVVMALALRGWPPATLLAVLQGFGPSALLLATSSGLPPAVALFLLAGGTPEQVANFAQNPSKNNGIKGKIGSCKNGYKQKPK